MRSSDFFFYYLVIQFSLFFQFLFFFLFLFFLFFFSSRRRHTRCLSDWSSDVCSSDLVAFAHAVLQELGHRALRAQGLQRREVHVVEDDHERAPSRLLLEEVRRDARLGGDRKSVV